MTRRDDGTLQCDMEYECTKEVRMIDNKGYIYCYEHGLDRRYWHPCRQLRNHELARLRRGERLVSY